MNNGPTNKIRALHAATMLAAQELGVPLRMTWEDRISAGDPNLAIDESDPNLAKSGGRPVVGGFRMQIGDREKDTHFVAIRELAEGNHGRSGLIVGSHVVPLGIRVEGSQPTALRQNPYFDKLAGPNATMNRASAVREATSGGWAGGIPFWGAILAGSAQEAARRGFGSSEFHQLLGALFSPAPSYTGKGPGEGGAPYESPMALVIGGAGGLGVNQNSLSIPGAKGAYFLTTQGEARTPDGDPYRYSGYTSQTDWAYDHGLRPGDKPGLWQHWESNPGKVVSSGRRTTRERYGMLGNDFDTSGVPILPGSVRETTRGRTMWVGVTTDEATTRRFGLGEGVMIGSNELLTTASYASARFEQVAISPTADLFSLSVNRSSMGQASQPGKMLKGGWAEPIGSVEINGDTRTLMLPSSGYKRREFDENPILKIGSHPESAKQFVEALFGDSPTIDAGGTILGKQTAYEAISNNIKQKRGQSAESHAALLKERQEVLGLVRTAWTNKLNTDYAGSALSRMPVIFSNEDNNPTIQGGEGYHDTAIVFGVRGMLGSGSIKTPFGKGVAAYNQELTPSMRGTSIVAAEKDLMKGPGLLDARHQYWYRTDKKYAGWYDRNYNDPSVTNLTPQQTARIQTRLERLDVNWRNENRLNNDPNGIKWFPADMPATAAEYTSTGRMTIADMFRAHEARIMGDEEFNSFADKFGDTPHFKLLTSLDSNYGSPFAPKDFRPIIPEESREILPEERLRAISTTLQNEYGWDPESRGGINVNGLVVPSPSQMGLLKSERGTIRQYEKLFSGASLDVRRKALEDVQNAANEFLNTETARAEIGKAGTEASIYTSYSADPTLAGKSAIRVGEEQLRELYARSGGAGDRLQEMLTRAGLGNNRSEWKEGHVGTAWIGREPGQVALMPVNVIFDPKMPRFAAPSVSPEFELLSLGDSDGDPMKIFLRDEKYSAPIKGDFLARKAFGTFASMKGIGATLAHMDKYAQGTRSDAEYLQALAFGTDAEGRKDAMNFKVGNKAQSVALDRANTFKEGQEKLTEVIEHKRRTKVYAPKMTTYSSSDIQNLILEDIKGHGEMGIYNLVQSVRAGLNRSAIDQAFAGGDIDRINSLAGTSSSDLMATGLGKWYQYPLDLQKMPGSMARAYSLFNWEMADELQEGKDRSAITSDLLGAMYRDAVVGEDGKPTYTHDSYELASLVGNDKESIQKAFKAVEEGRANDSLWKDVGEKIGDPNSTVMGRVLSVSSAIQFETERMRGRVKQASDGSWLRAAKQREQTETSADVKWEPVSDQYLASVKEGLDPKNQGLLDRMRMIRRKAGFGTNFYNAFKNAPGNLGKLFGGINATGKEIVHSEYEESVPWDTRADLNSYEEAVQNSVPLVKGGNLPTPPGVDKEKIDAIQGRKGSLTVDVESLFNAAETDPTKRSNVGIYQSAYVSGGKGEVFWHPIGKYHQDVYGARANEAVPFAENNEARRMYSKVIASQPDSVRNRVMSDDPNDSSEVYAAKLAALKEGDVVIGHNIVGADDKWLRGVAVDRNGNATIKPRPPTKATFQDTMEIESLFLGTNSGTNLQDTIDRRSAYDPKLKAFNVSLGGEAHEGLHDALQTEALYESQIQQMAGMPTRYLEALATGEWDEANGDGERNKRMGVFFKSALEHKRANNIPDIDDEKQAGILNTIAKRGIFSGKGKDGKAWLPRQAETRKAAFGNKGAAFGPPQGGGGGGGGGDDGDGGMDSSPGWMSHLIGSLDSLNDATMRGAQNSGAMLKALNRIVARQTAGSNLKYKEGASAGMAESIVQHFGGDNPYSQDELEADSLQYGTAVRSLLQLEQERVNPLTPAGRQVQIARSLGSHATKLIEQGFKDKAGGRPDQVVLDAARLLSEHSLDATRRSGELANRSGPAYDERLQAQARSRANGIAALQELGKAELAELGDHPAMKGFLQALETIGSAFKDVTKTIKDFDEGLISKKEAKERLGRTGSAWDVETAKKKAEAFIDVMPEDKKGARAHMRATLEGMLDPTGVKPGSLLSEEQGDSLRRINQPDKPSGAQANLGKIMGGFMLFQMARDFRMTAQPIIAGGMEEFQSRDNPWIHDPSPTPLRDVYGAGYAGIQSLSRVGSNMNRQFYNTVSGAASLVGGPLDSITRDPLVGGAIASGMLGLGATIGTGLAASGATAAGFVGLGLGLSAVAPFVGLGVGAAAAISSFAGWKGDTAIRGGEWATGSAPYGPGSETAMIYGDELNRRGVSLAGLQNNNGLFYPAPDEALTASQAQQLAQSRGQAVGAQGMPQGGNLAPRPTFTRPTLYASPATLRAGMVEALTSTNGPYAATFSYYGISKDDQKELVRGAYSIGLTESGPKNVDEIDYLSRLRGAGLSPSDAVNMRADMGSIIDPFSAKPGSVSNKYAFGMMPGAFSQYKINMAAYGDQVSWKQGLGVSGTQARDEAAFGGLTKATDDRVRAKAQGAAIGTMMGAVAMDPVGMIAAAAAGTAFGSAGQPYDDRTMTALSRFYGNDPYMTAVGASMGRFLPPTYRPFQSDGFGGAQEAWSLSTRMDVQNYAPLFQKSLSGLSPFFEANVDWQETRVSGNMTQMKPVIKSALMKANGTTMANLVNEEFTRMSPAYSAAKARGVQFGDDWLSAAGGGYLQGFTGGRDEVIELGAQKSYQNSLASVGISMQQAQLSRDFELNVTRPQRDISLQMQGISLFGGSMETKYGNYSAMGSFYWQQQELNFARQTSAIQFGRAMQGNQWEQQSAQLGRQGQLASRAVGRYDLGYQHTDIQLGHQYFQEDWSLNQQKRQLSFGWQQEDYGRNIRRATGFEKQQMIREQGRSVEMFNLETKQFEREKTREEAKYKREEERWQVQKKHFEQMNALEDARFAIEQEQINKKKAWAEEDFQRENEAHDRQQKQLEEQKEAALLQYKMDKDKRDEEYKFSDRQFKLQMQALGVQAQQIQDAETLRVLLQNMDREAELRARINAKRFEELFLSVLKGIATRLGIPLTIYDGSDQPEPDHKPTTGAMGASVKAGKSIIVGEYGPELVKFERDATVVPTHKTITQTMGPGRWEGGRTSETPVILKIDGKVIAEAVIQHGGPAMNRNQRRTFGL